MGVPTPAANVFFVLAMTTIFFFLKETEYLQQTIHFPLGTLMEIGFLLEGLCFFPVAVGRYQNDLFVDRMAGVFRRSRTLGSVWKRR